LGGHTHTFLDAPVTVKNTDGKDVIVNQAGWAGLRLGKITLEV
jgi:5'-nucleotidase